MYLQDKVRRGAEGVTLREKEAAGCGSFGSVEECNEKDETIDYDSIRMRFRRLGGID